MGHYDDCYEKDAQEKRRKFSAQSKNILDKKDPGELRGIVKLLIRSMEESQQSQLTFSYMEKAKELFHV